MFSRPLLLILLVAAAIRLFPFTWGAPPRAAYADELYHVEQALALYENPRLIFHEPYTPLYDRLLSLALAPAWAVHRASGLKPGAGVFYLGRILSALFDVIAVALTFQLGLILLGDRRAAALAALMHVFAFEAVRHSHYAVPDTLSLLLSNAALIAGLRLRIAGITRRGLILAGGFAAMAAATKFNNLLLLPVLAVMAVAAPGIPGRPMSRPVRVLLLCGVFGAVLLVLFPAIPHFIRQELLLNREAAGTGGLFRLGSEGGPFAMFLHNYAIPHEELAHRSIWSAISALPALFGMAGALYFLFRKPALFSLPLLYVLLTFWPAARVNIVRYAMPAFPILFICGAGLALRLTENRRAIVFPALGLLLLAAPVFRAARLDVLLSHKDSRVIAGEWIASNIPKGAAVALFRNHFWSNPLMAAGDYRIVDIPFVLYGRDGLERDRAKPLSAYAADAVDYFIINSFMTGHHCNPASRERLPGVVRSFEDFYASLDRECELLYRYDKNGRDRPGPSIRIYKVRRPGADG